MTESMISSDQKTESDFEYQRQHGWPDFHPEDYCHRCGNPNCVWWIDSDVWNKVMRDENGNQKWWGIVCPSCFAELSGDLMFEFVVDPKGIKGQNFLAGLNG